MITCLECRGECCKKLAFNIEAPKNIIDFQDIKWYLYHEGVIVYIDNEGDWMVQVPVKCTKLGKNGRCTIYEDRPPICRMSKVEDCEKNTDEMAVVFRTVKDLESYMNKSLKKKRK
jgi:Fe-S-cluster containining protein